MVDISHETPEQTDARLREVLAQAEVERLAGTWCFVESPRDATVTIHAEALAAVRDREVLSQLIPAGGAERERFSVFSFHFPSDRDNSGFVGWLASELKRGLGTGVFVICGSNSGHGGVYDYWGVPDALGDEAEALVARLSRREQR